MMSGHVLRPKKLAVLEFSSTSCKLLVGNVRQLTEGFRWGEPAFVNRSVMTNAWFDLHVRKWGAKTVFQRRLQPAITDLRTVLFKHSPDSIHCVATSGFRKTQMENALRRMLEAELTQQIHVLSAEEEAKATVDAYLWSKTRGDRACLFIDQGGGTTEIAHLQENGDRSLSYSLPMGTLSALVRFVHQEQSLEELFSAVDVPTSLVLPTDLNVVASGSALTNCLGLRSNQRQHERVLAKSFLEERTQQIQRRIRLQYTNAEQVRQTLLQTDQRAMLLQNEIKSWSGLQFFIRVLEAANQDRIRINGAGLRYGIFRQQLNRYYPDFEQHPERYDLWEEAALKEGQIVNGTISRISQAGIVVRFGRYEGLIQRRKLKGKGMRDIRRKFEQMSSLRVRITSVRERADGRTILLSMWDSQGQRL